MSVRTLVAPTLALALSLSSASCSSSPFGSSDIPDEEADRLLTKPIGLLATESATGLDSAAVEAILPGTHRRVTTTGYGVDTDIQLRRIRDPSTGVDRFFTLHANQGVLVERDRTGASLARYDVTDGEPKGANPLDIAIAPDGRFFVTRHAAKTLLVLDPFTRARATVDLSPFADADGKPDMSAIAIVDRTAYVALRRLTNGFEVRETSTVVAIDVDTLAVTPFVDLPAKDPGAEFHWAFGKLWISCIGGPLMDPPNRDAGLVKIDLATKTATKVIDGASGFVTAFDFAEEGKGYAIVAGWSATNPTALYRFDPDSGKLDDLPWAATDTYRLWDVAVVPGSDLLLLGDRSPEAPRIRVLSRTDGAWLGSIRTELPPVEVLAIRDDGA